MPARSQTSTTAIVAAGRRLLEDRGIDALTMRDVAEAVGVRAPSLYKRMRDRSDLFRLILEDVADELTSTLDAAASSGDAATDLRTMVAAYRAFAHANPVTYTLMFAPHAMSGATARSVRSSSTFLDVVAELAGRPNALPAARTIVAWAHGFITMELAGAFQLGGDVERAWTFGLERVLAAVKGTGDTPVPLRGEGFSAGQGRAAPRRTAARATRDGLPRRDDGS